MLVSSAVMLRAALEGGYAVAQFNLNNLEWLRAILEAAEENAAPVILGVTRAAADYMGGLNTVAALTERFVAGFRPSVPVALHFDHGAQYTCLEAIGAGFTAVMFDGSAMPFSENLLITRALGDFCAKRGVALEAELGSPAGEEDGVSGDGAKASIEECAALAAAGVTCLAPAIGNIHGVYPPDWPGLDLELLSRIHAAIPETPLALHGGTGVPNEQIMKAVKKGVCKINVNTECQIAFSDALAAYFAGSCHKETKGYNLQKIMKPAIAAVRAKACEKICLFGSDGKAR